jgi:hypothetical protein
MAKAAWSGQGAVGLLCLGLVVVVVAIFVFAGARALGGEAGTGVDAVARALAGGIGAAPLGVALLAHTSFLFALSPGGAVGAKAAGALVCLVFAVRAATAHDLARALGNALTAMLGLVLFAFGAGAPAAAVLLFVALLLGSSALAAAAACLEPGTARFGDLSSRGPAPRRTRNAFWMGACAVGVGPLALTGVFAPLEVAFLCARGPGVLAMILLGVATLAFAIVAFALFRAHRLAFVGRASLPVRGADAEPEGVRVAGALAVAALFVVPAVGLGGTALGGEPEPLALRALAPAFAFAMAHPDGAGLPGLRWALGVGGGIEWVGFGAWAFARRRYADPEDGTRRDLRGVVGVAERAARRTSLVVRASAALVGSATVAAARELDRWVVQGAIDAAASAGRALAWVVTRLDAKVLDAPGRAVARRVHVAVPAERALALVAALVGAVLLATLLAIFGVLR